MRGGILRGSDKGYLSDKIKMLVNCFSLLIPSANLLGNTQKQWAAGQCSWYSDSLRAGRLGVRNAVGARFSGPHADRPRDPPSCKMGIGSFCQG
jgi:hypothetical protein